MFSCQYLNIILITDIAKSKAKQIAFFNPSKYYFAPDP